MAERALPSAVTGRVERTPLWREASDWAGVGDIGMLQAPAVGPTAYGAGRPAVKEFTLMQGQPHLRVAHGRNCHAHSTSEIEPKLLQTLLTDEDAARFIETVVVKAQPKLRGLPYQRYIREALEHVQARWQGPMKVDRRAIGFGRCATRAILRLGHLARWC